MTVISVHGRCWLQTVLICGWREEAFMSDLLREMDHGPSALPAGTKIVLFNNTSNDEITSRVRARNRSELLPSSLILEVVLNRDDMLARAISC
jgi:hypothetical protein